MIRNLFMHWGMPVFSVWMCLYLKAINFYALVQVFPWVTCESPRHNDKTKALPLSLRLHNANLTTLRSSPKTYFTAFLTKQEHFLPYLPSKHSLNTPHSSLKTHLTITLSTPRSPQLNLVLHTPHTDNTKAAPLSVQPQKTVSYQSKFLFQRLPNYMSCTRLLSWS